MNWDQATIHAVCFAALMILPIAPGAVWYRNQTLKRTPPADRERILRSLAAHTRRVWIAWAVGVIAIGAWIGLGQSSGGALTGIMPMNLAVLIVCYLVAFPFALPMLNRLEQLISETNPGKRLVDPVREATLKPRRMLDYMPKYWVAVIAVVMASGLFVVAEALLQAGEIESRFVWMALGFAAFAVFELVVWAVAMRMEVTGEATYGGLTPAAAQELRQFRVRGFFWMLLAMAVVLFTCALGSVEVGRGAIAEPNMGILGGVLGTVVGFAGAGFGVAASLKMNRLRQESNAAKS